MRRAITHLLRTAAQQGLGIAIVSTSRGVMSDRKAREMRVGGEVVATVC